MKTVIVPIALGALGGSPSKAIIIVEKMEKEDIIVTLQTTVIIRNTKMLWRKVGSKLIFITPKINDKNQKIDLEILFGLTHLITTQYPQIVQKHFFDWSIDIFQSLIDYLKISKKQWRLVTAACKICPKYTKGIIAILHPHRVTYWHYVTVEKKENIRRTVNAKLWMQFMTVVTLQQIHK